MRLRYDLFISASSNKLILHANKKMHKITKMCSYYYMKWKFFMFSIGIVYTTNVFITNAGSNLIIEYDPVDPMFSRVLYSKYRNLHYR